MHDLECSSSATHKRLAVAVVAILPAARSGALRVLDDVREETMWIHRQGSAAGWFASNDNPQIVKIPANDHNVVTPGFTLPGSAVGLPWAEHYRTTEMRLAHRIVLMLPVELDDALAVIGLATGLLLRQHDSHPPINWAKATADLYKSLRFNANQLAMIAATRLSRPRVDP